MTMALLIGYLVFSWFLGYSVGLKLRMLKMAVEAA